MEQYEEYRRISPKQKEEMSKQVAALLFLQQNVNPWICKTEQIIQCCGDGNPFTSYVTIAWLKWKKTLSLTCKNLSQKWPEWLASEIFVVFKPFEKYKCCPDAVKDIARVYTNAAKQLYWETGHFDPNEMCRLTRNDWEKLEIATTALFFREWLSNHPQMRQSILGFANAPFGRPIPAKQKEEDENATRPVDIQYRALCSARKELAIMLEMGQIQRAREMQYKPPALNKVTVGYSISYPHLCAMEFIAKRKPKNSKGTYDEKNGRDTSCFRIFKYISQRRSTFETPSDKCLFLKIARACADYSEVLDEIAEWGKLTNTGEFTDAKRYVIGSIMVTELEEAYRLHFASAAAAVPESEKRKGTSADCKEQESWIAQCILGRIPYKKASLNTQFNEQMKDAEIAHNILNYRTDLKQIYTVPIEQSKVYIDKTILLRTEQLNLMAVLNSIFQKQLQREWSDSDFQSVAQFLYKEYNVVDALRKITFPPLDNTDEASECRKKHYSKMQKFYEMVQTWEIGGKNQAYLDYRQVVKKQKNYN